MAVLYTNNATTTLSGAITNVATSISVATGTGALFPSPTNPDFFYATLVDSSNNIEIVKVTARTSDTMTVTRAQEGTTARAYAAGDRFELRVTAAGLGNKLDKDTGGTVSGLVTLGAGLTFSSTTAVTLAAGTTNFNTGTANFAAGLQLGGVSVITGASTATLTNKTFDTTGTGNVFRINGNQLSASAGSATFTLPGTTTDTLVSLTATQTLTNKTLSGATINGTSAISASNVNADNTITDTNTIAANSPGFRGLPIAGGAAKTANYQLGLSDAGKDVQMNATGLTLTIPSNSTAFPPGTTIVVSNLFAGNLTLAITTDSLFIAGTTTGGAGVSRTIAQNGQVTLTKKTSTVWWVSGAGLS